MKMQFLTIDSFNKDFKKLLSRYCTLEDDFLMFKNYPLQAYHSRNENNNIFFPIAGLGIHHPRFSFIKVKKFTCRALKGRGVQSGIRIVYCYDNQKKKVTFIEIYFKQDQTECDHKRIKDFYSAIK